MAADFRVAAAPPGIGSMQCPKCRQATLNERGIKGRDLQLDHCSSCHGLWFDAGELCSLLGSKAVTPFNIPGFAQRNADRLCPKCQQPLLEFCYPGTVSLVDACQDCRGVWLDDNEWQEIGKARCEKNMMTCPKCNTTHVKADTCGACGIVIAKYLALSQQDPSPAAEQASEQNIAREQSYADDIPGIKGGLLRFIDR